MIDSILNYIGSFFSGMFDYLVTLANSFNYWLLDVLWWFAAYLINSIVEMVQYIILALIALVNTAVLLLPACSAPVITLNEFSSTYNTTGSTLASAVCWVLPVDFLITLMACTFQAVLAYFAISWGLRWLKVIK